MLFSWLVLLLVAWVSCSVLPLNGEEKCTTRDCEYLYENYVRRVELNEKIPCKNVHAYLCNKDDLDVEDYVWQQYLYLMDNVTLILTSDSFDRGGEALQSEKKLYKQCLNLGTASELARKEINDTLLYLKELQERSANNRSWQEIDEMVYQADMGRAFFEIRAVQDQDNLEKNIIMITPPDLTSLLNIYQVFNETVEDSKLRDHARTHPMYNSIFEFFEDQKLRPLREFFSSLFDAAAQYLRGIPKDYEDSKNFKVSLRNWTQEFNRHRNEENQTYINFEVIIRDAFKNVGISVQENEFIIVKNHPYFNELFQVLSNTDNEIIGLAVVMKALVDNLRYFNWNFAQLINRVDKSSFCLKETKLYGVSYEILNAFKSGRWPFQLYNSEESFKIIDNIKNSLKLKIIDAKLLTHTREAYLTNQLDIITANILKNISTRDTIFTDYDLFKPSNSYFRNINDYRHMLRLKELSNLKMHPQISTKYPPFSLVYLVEPSNRFTINALLSGSELPKQFVPKQVYYGSYGVRMASLAYALLNENKYHDISYVYLNRSVMYRYYDYDFEKISPVFINSKDALDPNPDYHLDKMQCFLPEIHNKPVVDKTRDLENMVSDVYGLQLAYDAMVKVDLNDANSSIILFPKQNLHNLRQFFYLAYVKSRCKTREEYTNAVVFNDEYFTDNFRMCAKEYSICQMTPFEHISNNIFLI